MASTLGKRNFVRGHTRYSIMFLSAISLCISLYLPSFSFFLYVYHSISLPVVLFLSLTSSTLMISTAAKGQVASLVAVNTTLGAAAGALSGLFTSTIIDERKTGIYQWDTTAAMNGCLTGLVGITAGCATVEPWAAVVIGIVAGWLYLGASTLMLRLKIDDAVDAIPVHMFGGAWGVIATGLFSNETRLEMAEYSTKNIGWFYEWGRGSGNFTPIGIQVGINLLVPIVCHMPLCILSNSKQ